jgi:hypothetical protein
MTIARRKPGEPLADELWWVLIDWIYASHYGTAMPSTVERGLEIFQQRVEQFWRDCETAQAEEGQGRGPVLSLPGPSLSRRASPPE